MNASRLKTAMTLRHAKFFFSFFSWGESLPIREFKKTNKKQTDRFTFLKKGKNFLTFIQKHIFVFIKTRNIKAKSLLVMQFSYRLHLLLDRRDCFCLFVFSKKCVSAGLFFPVDFIVDR